MEKASIKRNLLIYSLFVIMFFFALSSTITGAVMPELRAHYGMTMSQIGYMNVAQNVGSLLILILGGLLAEKFAKAKTVAVLFIVFTAVTYCMGLMPPYVLLLACLLLVGVSGGYLNMIISAFIPELRPDKTAYYMSICHGFYGLGLFFGSVYGIFMKTGIPWNNVYISVGILYTVVAALYLLLLFTAAGREGSAGAIRRVPEAAHAPEKRSYWRLAVSPAMLLLFITSVFYMGQQFVITNFLTVYAASNLSSAPALLSGLPIICYWIGVVAGRFIQPAVDRRIDTRKWMISGALASSALLLTSLLISNAYYLMAALLVSGALTGAAFPSLIAMACGRYPSQTGAATSIVCLGSSAGGILLPLLVGFISDRTGSEALGMVVIPAATLLAAGTLMLLGRTAKARRAG